MKLVGQLTALLILCNNGLAQVKEIDERWITVSYPLKWEAPPRETGLKIKTAAAAIMVLYPSGDFAEVRCHLIRQSNGRVNIPRNPGHTVATGTWNLSGDVLSITSHVVYTDALPIGKPIPGPETTTQFKAQVHDRYWLIANSNTRFRPMPQFTDLEFLRTVITCDRSFWDGHSWQDGAVSPRVSELNK